MKPTKRIGMSLLSLIVLVVLCGAVTVRAQTSDGVYVIERSVTAPGGNAGNGLVSVDGAIGQAAAGTRSVNQPFVVTGGFWTAPPAAPTAAMVEIGGRVITPNGQGLTNAVVLLTAQNGEQRAARTGSFGYFQFPGIQSGQTYVISIKSRRYAFDSQVLFVSSSFLELEFTGSPFP